MSLRFIVVGLAALATLTVFAGMASAQDGPPGPSAGTVLVSDLIAPRGMVVGPDGLIYVAEAGTGGDTEFVTPSGETVNNGFTGRISSIDPETGERTTLAEGLPSQRLEMGDQIGPADVAFIGSALYYLQTHGGEHYGFPDNPTGIYRVQSNGTVDLVADIGQFNIDNPVAAIGSGAQPDVEVGGNPYSMIVRDGQFYVSDGNHNRLLEVTTGGDVSEIVEFPDHPVSTGIAQTTSGPFLVGYLGRGPFLPDDGRVVSVSPAGTITEIARGVPMITDVEVGTGGQRYALSFADGFAPFTGSVQRINADGTMTTIVAGLTFATDMIFIGDTLYVTDDGLSALGPGELIAIENFSAVQPPAPAPTAAPTQGAPAPTPTVGTGVTAPDTGSGGYTDSSGGATTIVVAIALAVAAAAASGLAALAWKRR
ncbi:MAG: ScyD/ScyE family protein [Dehalococcoidia bacterium]